MKEYQTPQKEHSRLSNRRSKDSQSKNTRNVTKKSLELALDPSLSVSSEPFLFSDLSPSSFITVDIDELSDLSPDHHRFDRLDGSKFGSAEADVAVSYLKRALNQDLDGLVLDLLLLELLRVRLMKEECLSEMYTSKSVEAVFLRAVCPPHFGSLVLFPSRSVLPFFTVVFCSGLLSSGALSSPIHRSLGLELLVRLDPGWCCALAELGGSNFHSFGFDLRWLPRSCIMSDWSCFCVRILLILVAWACSLLGSGAVFGGVDCCAVIVTLPSNVIFVL
ncbi:hypothetical protein ACOSQ2_028471 [Xanthoceras sorbifolium]